MNTFNVINVQTSFDSRDRKQQVVIRYSDGSEEYHNDLGPAVITRVKQWCAQGTPLARSSCGAVIEASLTGAEEQAAIKHFTDLIYAERERRASKTHGGSFDALSEEEDQIDSPQKWAEMIRLFVESPSTSLSNFQEGMLAISEISYSAHQWAQRQLNKAELIAENQNDDED